MPRKYKFLINGKVYHADPEKGELRGEVSWVPQDGYSIYRYKQFDKAIKMPIAFIWKSGEFWLCQKGGTGPRVFKSIKEAVEYFATVY